MEAQAHKSHLQKGKHNLAIVSCRVSAHASIFITGGKKSENEILYFFIWIYGAQSLSVFYYPRLHSCARLRRKKKEARQIQSPFLVLITRWGSDTANRNYYGPVNLCIRH
ncbi:Uncharacterized protein TCM_033941 [Theobroma cacao]|uniref:Uncharacterized protein n=1 Tax=Theobroma cacao TaxID=3641 RepID=A0A061FD46_THECC|nr:Uncharacterized protein TCM_033941 [Theobroma cacao]